MPDDKEHEQRALKLILQALQEAGIDERDSPSYMPFGNTDAYYRKDKYNNVQVEFSQVKMFSGDLRCTLGLNYLSQETARLFPDDAEALATLIAMLNYLKDVASKILPDTAQKLFQRRRNFTFKSLSAYQRKNIRAAERELRASLLASVDHRYVQKQRDWEKEFRAVEGRGGSGAKLRASDRRSLPGQYDDIHKTAKPIKKAYRATFKTFEASRQRKGYQWSEWQEFWIKYAVDLFGGDTDFLSLFCEKDSPSASEVAYRWLAAKTGYKVAYLSRLITAARKKAQSNK